MTEKPEDDDSAGQHLDDDTLLDAQVPSVDPHVLASRAAYPGAPDGTGETKGTVAQPGERWTTCSTCGVATPDGNFCSSCGGALEQKRFCGECGLVYTVGTTICERCGTPTAA